MRSEGQCDHVGRACHWYVTWTSPLQANHSTTVDGPNDSFTNNPTKRFMNKKEKTNANKSPARDVHATDSSTLPSPDGHVVYPELIRSVSVTQKLILRSYDRLLYPVRLTTDRFEFTGPKPD